jgi:hypothetical protein
MKVAVHFRMTTGTEQTTRAQCHSGPLHGQRNTLPFPPPTPNLSDVPAKGSGSERPSLPENLFQDDPSSWDDPWEGLFEEVSPPRRRWPAILAFSITGLAVTLIGVAVAGHLRHQIAANGIPSERALEPRKRAHTPLRSPWHNSRRSQQGNPLRSLPVMYSITCTSSHSKRLPSAPSPQFSTELRTAPGAAAGAAGH